MEIPEEGSRVEHQMMLVKHLLETIDAKPRKRSITRSELKQVWGWLHTQWNDLKKAEIASTKGA